MHVCIRNLNVPGMYVYLLTVEVNYKDIKNKVLYIITNKENKKNIKIMNMNMEYGHDDQSEYDMYTSIAYNQEV